MIGKLREIYVFLWFDKISIISLWGEFFIGKLVPKALWKDKAHLTWNNCTNCLYSFVFKIWGTCYKPQYHETIKLLQCSLHWAGKKTPGTIQSNLDFYIALNLHLLTDSKALGTCCIQPHSHLTISLIAVRKKPEYSEETNAEEPVRRHQIYTCYGI